MSRSLSEESSGLQPTSPVAAVKESPSTKAIALPQNETSVISAVSDIRGQVPEGAALERLAHVDVQQSSASSQVARMEKPSIGDWMNTWWVKKPKGSHGECRTILFSGPAFACQIKAR